MSYLNFFNMNGAPSGGLLIFDPTILNDSGNLNYFKMAILLAKQLGNMANPLGNQNGAPVGSMTADQHAVKTTSGTVRNAAKGEITALADGTLLPDLPKKTSFTDTKFGKFGGQYGGAIGDTASMIGNAIGKRGLDGKYGGITKGMDTAYDTIQKAALNFGPVGNIVSGAMGVGKLLGNAVSKIGGGTDGMTKTDAIMNSAFLNLTPLGLINGFGGKRANTYTRNKELDAQTNGGFLGFLATLDVTQIGAGKKYGLFSSSARKKQNELTEFTLNMKHTISGIVDTNTINNLAAQGSTPFLAQQLAIDLSGGIQQMRAARHGMLFSRRVISKYLVGNKLKRTIKVLDTATNQYVEIPLNLTKDLIKGREPIKLLDRVVYMAGNGTVSSDHWESGERKQHLTPKGLEGLKVEEFKQGGKKVRSIEELITYAKFKNPEFIQRMTKTPIPVYFIDTKSKTPDRKLEGTHYMANDGNYVYPMILPVSGKMTFLGDKAKEEALRTGNYIEFNSPEEAELFATLYKLGWPEFFLQYDKMNSIPSLYKQGGQMNVIPEGALHARLNHLDLINDDLTHVTTKGIPVITKEGGEVIQHAEIEHSEIIFTLEVTNKIEDLRKKWHEDKEDKYAIEAGKLLVKEILHNTDDRTNLIESVE